MFSKSITLTRKYPHLIDKVWSALTDAEALSTWLMPCNMVPQKGNKFQFITKPAPGFDGIVQCEILELAPPRLLKFSWSGGSLKNTLVTFELEPLGDETLLRFTHSGFEGLINRLIVRNILAQGWTRKILTLQLVKFLDYE